LRVVEDEKIVEGEKSKETKKGKKTSSKEKRTATLEKAVRSDCSGMKTRHCSSVSAVEGLNASKWHPPPPYPAHPLHSKFHRWSSESPD